MPLPACASEKALPSEAEAAWWHIFGFLNQDVLREEVAAAEAEAARNLTSETWRRQKALVEALARIRSGEPDGIGLVDA
jgi:DNA primase